jgi:hypothetical protein
MVKREHERHLERLKAMLQSAEDSKYAPIDPDFLAFDEEFSRIAPQPGWKDGTTHTYPDHALAYYGRPYSEREYFQLAMRRALQKRGCYSEEEVDERLGAWMAWFKENGALDEERCLGGRGGV